MGKTYKFAIVGCGMIAQIHAKAIGEISGCVVHGVYDPTKENAETFSEKHDCLVYPTLEALLGDPKVDVVNICTPSGTHAAIAVTATGLGKHVVVEKPLAIRLEDAEAVVRAQAENGVQVCVISQLRFSSGVQALRTAIRNGDLGQLVLASLSMRYYRSREYYEKGGWRGRWSTDGGGALMNQGIHGLDLLCYLCGPIVSVRTTSKTLLHDIEVEDTLCAAVEFENGALGTVEASTAVKPGYPRRIEISGSLGSAVLTEDAITEWQAEAPLPDTETGWKMNAANDPAALDVTGHRLQLENLLAAVEGREKLLVDASAGRDIVKVILGMYQSAQNGETVRF